MVVENKLFINLKMENFVAQNLKILVQNKKQINRESTLGKKMPPMSLDQRHYRRDLMLNGLSKKMNLVPRDPFKLKICIENSKRRMLNGLSKKMNLVPRDSNKVEKVKKLNKERMMNGQAKLMNSINIEGRKIKQRKTFENKGLWLKIEDLTDYKKYVRQVWVFTNISSKFKYTEEELKQRGQKKELNHKNLDHIFSIYEGFKLGILPIIIGSKSNIRLIDCYHNYSKNSKCEITTDELFRNFEKEGEKS
jgi:hypothetical protein